MVATEAGLTTGAVYSNFKSKEDLFLALYEERIASRARELREAASAGGGDGEGLQSAAANATSTLSRDRDWLLLYFEFALHAARDPKFRRRFRALRRQGLEELTRGMEDGLRRAGADPAAAPSVARAIRAASYGVALEHVLGEACPGDDTLADAYRMIFRGAL